LAPLTNALFTSPTGVALNYPRSVIMSGPVDNYKYRELWASTPGARHRYLLQLRWWLLPEIPTTPLRGSAIDVFFNFGGGCCRRYQQHLPRGPPSTSSSTSVVGAAEDTGSTPRAPPSMSSLASVVAADGDTDNTALGGPTIDVFFSFGGGCCQRYWHHPQGGQPSTCSLASVVVAAGSTSQGPCHRRLLQLRWWLLPVSGDTSSTPRGPPLMSFSILVVAAAGSTPRGPPLMSSSISVVAPAGSTLRGQPSTFG
jgi:hypothetical protein